MQRKTVAVILVLLLLAFLSACAAYQAQHSGAAPTGPHEHHKMQEPSSLFTMQSSEEQLAQIHGEVDQTKQRLAEEGKYACCVRPACNQCLLRFGECHCRKAIHEQGVGCGECMEGWVEGRGTVEGVTAAELLERQKRAAGEGEGGGEKPPLR